MFHEQNEKLVKAICASCRYVGELPWLPRASCATHLLPDYILPLLAVGTSLGHQVTGKTSRFFRFGDFFPDSFRPTFGAFCKVFNTAMRFVTSPRCGC